MKIFSAYRPNFTALNNNKYPKLAPLPYDSVSFGAMKKREFSEIDLVAVNRFKAPIEKFNSNSDLQKWADDRTEEILNKEEGYGGRSIDTETKGWNILEDWLECLEEENGYKPTTKLLIIDSLTKKLKSNNDKIPPVLNKKVLAETIDELSNSPEKFVNFNKTYSHNLIEYCLQERRGGLDKNGTGWIKIPSYKNDEEHFYDNVTKLNALSMDSWCTKSSGAENHLNEGDFYIYLENYKAKVGISTNSGKITEIQGGKNDGNMPEEYKDIIKDFCEKNLN